MVKGLGFRVEGISIGFVNLIYKITIGPYIRLETAFWPAFDGILKDVRQGYRRDTAFWPDFGWISQGCETDIP